MKHPADESDDEPLRPDFDRAAKQDSHGSDVTGTSVGTTWSFLSAKFWGIRQQKCASVEHFRGLIARAGQALEHPRAHIHALWLVPLALGVLSLLLGQDSNWDLLNYHLYNAYALLNGRIGQDLAPAQLQSYFNPLLDLPYYAMVTHWPAQVAGLVLGVVHGLNFVLLLLIARQVLGRDHAKTAIFLALAGCAGAVFLYHLGTTMGDNATSLFVLGALAVILWRWETFQRGGWHGIAVAVGAGLPMGLGVGLKLTNAIYAVALCATFFLFPVAWFARLRSAFVFGIGVLVGMSLTAGYWFAIMWHTFGNPLFPLFNNFFGAPLAAPVSAADMRYLPKSVWEVLLFPFIFTLDAKRIGEVSMRPFVWPILYVLMGWWAVAAARRAPAGALSAQARFVVVFIALAYLVWMALFSFHRYLVSVELLAPLAIWLLLHRFLPADTARRTATVVLTVVAIAAIVGFKSWRHEDWHAEAFRVDVPPLPTSSTVLLISGIRGEQPLGWMVPFFPREVAFVGLLTPFPEGPTFGARVRDILAERNGPIFAVIPAHVDARAISVAISRYGLALDLTSCHVHQAYVGRRLRPYKLCRATLLH